MDYDKIKETLDRFFNRSVVLNLKFNQLPKKLKNRYIVCLDAGGGYSDRGLGVNGYYSYVPNAQLVYKLANRLARTGEFEVFITHPLNYADELFVFDDEKNIYYKYVHIILGGIPPDPSKSTVGYENYSKKYTINDKQKAIIYLINYYNAILKNQKIYKLISISIQHNTAYDFSEKFKKKGIEVYYSDRTNAVIESKDLCAKIVKNCNGIYGTNQPQQAIQIGNFTVNEVSCPSVFVAVEFIDNPKKQKIIANDDKQNEMVEGLEKSILEFFKIL